MVHLSQEFTSSRLLKFIQSVSGSDDVINLDLRYDLSPKKPLKYDT